MPQFVPPGPFTGASAGLPGSSGLVPAPIAGQQGRVLTGDGIWSALVDNVGAAPVQSVNTRTGAIVLTKTDVGLANVDNTSDANKPVSTATTAAINAHANNTLNPHSVTKAQVGLGSVNNTSDVDKPVSTAQAAADTAVANAAASALSAHTSSTSNPHSVTKAQVGLGNADNTSDANKPVSTATQTALDLKANANDATLTGSPVATTASLGNNSTRIATTAFVTAAVAAGGGGGSGTSTRFTVEQTAHGFSAEQVVYNNGTAWVLARADATATAIGLGVIESVTANDFVLVVGGVMTLTGKTANTQYYLSAATAGLLTSTAPTNVAHFIVRIVKTNSTTSGLVEVGEPLALGLIANADLAEMTAGSVKANVTGSTGPASDVDIDTAFKTALALAKADVGLSNVDNTSDANKPVSTATQTALDLKANAANAALTGTPTAPTAPGGTSTTQLATTAFVATAISGVGGIPTGALAFWPTSAIGSPPTGFTPANGSNGTTNESAIGGLSIIAKHGGTVATPTFSPAAGEVASGTDVSILCATSNVVIRYTTGDGSQAAPTRSTGTVYSAPIDMTAAATLKAIAYRTPDTPSELMLNSSVASAAYTLPAGIPTPDLLHWPLNDPPGTTITALVGPGATGVTGTLNSNFYATVSGQGAIASSSNINWNTNLVTASFWLRRASYTGSAPIFRSVQINETPRFQFDQNGSITNVFIAGATGDSRQEYDFLFTLNTWHHVVTVFDNTTVAGTIKVYRDGSLVTPTTSPASTKTGTGNFATNALHLKSIFSDAQSFDMDDLRIYAGELSGAQITAIYSAGRP